MQSSYYEIHFVGGLAHSGVALSPDKSDFLAVCLRTAVASWF